MTGVILQEKVCRSYELLKSLE